MNEKRNHRFKDITGMRFGRLTVVALGSIGKNNRAMWKCKCDCGNEIVAIGKNLRNGNTKSCGCLNKQRSTERIVNYNYAHGGTHTRLFRIWSGMKTRCYNPQYSGYKYYGGKGVSICDEWSSFEAFREWAEANGYSDCLTIDRIDFNGNYEPSNCRWATPKEQAYNRSTARRKF